MHWDRQESWPSRRLHNLLRRAPAGCGLGETPVAGSRPLMGSVWPGFKRAKQSVTSGTQLMTLVEAVKLYQET